MHRHLSGIGLLALLFAAPLGAQVASTAAEDSSLIGVHSVALMITDANAALGSQLVDQIYSSTSLELRKSGLRVMRPDSTGNVTSPCDAVIQVMFFRRGRFTGDDVDMRFMVRQIVQLARTQKALWVTTWTTEQRGQNQVATEAARRMTLEAANTFLSKWLDVNGR